MDKQQLRDQILERLTADYQLLLREAKRSHQAATHEDNIPDSKYETLALEASYIAQGQANRAQQVKQAIEAYRDLQLQDFSQQATIRLSALVLLEDEDGNEKRVFVGPAAGGMKLSYAGQTIMLITPESPLGRELIGSQVDDCIRVESNPPREYEIIALS
jgi:transcription elongation GreA/GreB family factor